MSSDLILCESFGRHRIQQRCIDYFRAPEFVALRRPQPAGAIVLA